MVQADIPTDKQQDPWGRRQPGLGRDGCRTPMQWTPGEHAGFTGGRPWLATVDPNRARNVEVQLGDPDSMLSLTRRLIEVRRDSQALRSGCYEAVEGLPETVFAYRRRAGEETVSVYLNFGDEAVRVSAAGTLLVATRPGVAGPVGGVLALDGLDGAVLGS